jgi:dTDP-glucose 4,6-dehydratase
MEVWTCDTKHSHEDRYWRCDISQYRQLSKILEDYAFDLVYHLAAEFGRWNGEEYYEQLWMTNVIGTKNLIRLQEKHRFRMVFSSSSEVYGDYHGIMAEDIMELEEIRQMNDYALSKWVNELQIVNSEAMHDTETVRIRLFNVYGPGEYYTPYRSAVALFTFRALHDLPFTVYLNHQRTSLYIDDCVRSMADITDHFIPGQVYNLAGSQLHDMKFISDLVLHHLGKSDHLVLYKDAEPFTTQIKFPDISKAKRELNFSPLVSLEDGIPETVAWMQEVHTK